MSDATKEHPTVDLLITGISYISTAWPYQTRLADEVRALVAEVENQRRLRMLAEEAIPKGVEVARDYFAAEAEAKLARANAETDLVRQGLDLERTARLAAEDEAEKWRSEARRALAAEAALAALRGEVRVVAESLVWTGWRSGLPDEFGETYNEGECCVDCGEYRVPTGHAPDCRLAALLKRVGA